MARIDIKSAGATLNDGVLQLENGVAMDATLRNVADQNNTTSPLKLSTTAVQVVSPLRITTDDPSDMYLDCEDGATNNRFNITRNTASQQVNLNFASNPAGSTTTVGAIRTYVDGVNLSEIMTFREDGRLTIYNTLKSIFDNYSDLGTNSERFANVYALSGRFTNVSTNTLGPLGAATWINISSSVFSLVGGQLSVRGSGSTSATTSLLVQNSGGTETFRVYDSGSVSVGLGLTIGSGQSISDGTFALNNQNLQSYNSFSIETVPQNRQIKLRPASVEVLAANYYLGANQIGVVVYDTGSYSHDASAVLQANSTTRGFLPPRMTNAQRAAITTPAIGLMVYCTDAVEGLYVYKSTGWTFII